MWPKVTLWDARWPVGAHDIPGTEAVTDTPDRVASWGSDLARAGLLAAVYFSAAKLGLLLATVHENITLVWLPSGMALAAVLRFGYRVWPGIALGALSVTLSTGAPLGFAVATAIGNPLAALAGARLLNRFEFRPSMSSLRDAAALIILGAGVSTAVAATVGVTGLCLNGLGPWTDFARLWGSWWVGDAMGVVVAAPILLAWSGRDRVPIDHASGREAVVAMACLLLASLAAFAEPFHPTVRHLPLAFLPFPFAMWLALRFEARGASAAIFATAAIASLGTASGRGCLGHLALESGMWVLWPLIATLSTTALLLAGSSAERRRQRWALQAASIRLDRTVQQRTAELEEAKDELERSNQELQLLAAQDGLTQIANRRGFDARYAEEWNRCRRNGNWLSLILADVDWFKAYNDHEGHPAGDQCLRDIAAALDVRLKRSGDLLARFGGEEFAILLPETPPNGAEKVAEGLRATVEALQIPHPASETSEHVTISLGIASIRPGGDHPPAVLVAAADQQLYRSKSEGRNQIHGELLS
jgi:diguanylate cyclase (GGDEF)-like protein